MVRERFWERDDLGYREGRLVFAGRDVAALARAAGMPAFFYSAARIRTNLEAVGGALASTGLATGLYYAMKANRYQPLLTYIKTTGLAGVDVCSPGEMRLALACGFDEAEISYTATSVSNEDLDILALHPRVLVNCDSQSSLRRLAERSPGRTVGLRINPALGTGYGSSELLRYAGEKTTKFGIYKEQFAETLKLARDLGLPVRRIHFHTGCGYLDAQLEAWEKVLAGCLEFIGQVPDLEQVNIGGGLGVRHTPEDGTLDLARWAGIIKKTFAGRDFQVVAEPGDRIAKDAGVLVLEVNTVEKKKASTIVGVNGGFNLAVEPVRYGLHFEPVPCLLRSGALQPVTIAGNINEALDVWVEDFPFPPVAEGDLVAILNAGAYSTAMASNHCVRGALSERLLF